MRICKECQLPFEVTDEDRVLLDKISPVFDGKKQIIPDPTRCPDCRFQRKAAFRNELGLHKRKCDFTGQDVVSIFRTESTFPVYSQKVWWGDEWDPKKYGRDFDFSRPFFEQFFELRDVVPRLPLLSQKSENSEYMNHAANNRNCYLSVIVFRSEDVLYSRKVFNSSSVLDCAFIMNKGEWLYECFWCEDLYLSQFCRFCTNGSNLMFCYDCKGSSDCFMSSNLRNKRYVFYNRQLTKEEYHEKMRNILNGHYSKLEKLMVDFKNLQKTAIQPALHLEDCENVKGDFLFRSKDCFECYYSANGDSCRYCFEFDGGKDSGKVSTSCMDCFGFGASDLLYEVHSQTGGYHNQFCNWSYDVSESQYLDMCFNVSSCFGCVGLHGKEQYCVLNKQYTKGEYEELVPQIIEHMRTTGEWGEFFPASYSPFVYNESVAHEYFPLTKKVALEKGFRWFEYEPALPQVSKIISAEKLPDNIVDIPDDVLNWAINCEVTGKAFKIMPQELAFYRKMNLPLPRLHPEERYKRRMERNPSHLWQRPCDQCGLQLQTSYSPDRPEKVYCEACYLKEIY